MGLTSEERRELERQELRELRDATEDVTLLEIWSNGEVVDEVYGSGALPVPLPGERITLKKGDDPISKG